MPAIPVVTPTTKEMIWRTCYSQVFTNPMAMPLYYTTLFEMFKNLFFEMEDVVAYFDLLKDIREFEDYISDDLNPMTLAEAELRMFQNMDLLSGFEVRGDLITQMQINQRLEFMRKKLMQYLLQSMSEVRFLTPIRLG